jgi:mono/diheme cytochrome c family protein
MKIPTLLVSALALGPLSAAPGDQAVLDLFEKRCAECHGATKPKKKLPLHKGTDLSVLRANPNLVRPGKPAESNLIGVVTLPADDDERMPESSGKPGDEDYRAPLTPEEVQILKDWVSGTATPTPPTDPKPGTPSLPLSDLSPPANPASASRSLLPLDRDVRLAREDIGKHPEERRKFIRYVTLTNLYNARSGENDITDSDSDLEAYRAGVGKLLNSLSRKARIVPVEAVDPEKTLLRINLRDYGLSAADWEHTAGVYPYHVSVDPRNEALLNKETGTESPLIRADWFVFAASQPPLYHELLRIPAGKDAAQAVEESLGINVTENLKAGQALRAAFKESGVSQANRMIERHEQGPDGGGVAYWKSYDSSPLNATDANSFFRAPLGPVEAALTTDASLIFKHDGGEMIWNLPNGMQAYLLTTADGLRLNRAPTSIVQDSNRGDGAIINGISCIACHDKGMKYPPKAGTDLRKFTDEVGPVAAKSSLPFTEKRLVEKLYATPDRLQKAIADDEARFTTALLAATGGYTGKREPVSALYERFRRHLPASTIAAEFGVSQDEFLKKLADTDEREVHAFHARVQTGTPFDRQEFVRAFPILARELGYTPRTFTSLVLEEFGNAPEVPTATLVTNQSEGRPATGATNVLTLAARQSSYTEGEALILDLTVTNDSHVRVFGQTLDASGHPTGTINQLFPNKHDSDTLIKAGKATVLPKKAGDFICRAPFGTEVIIAIASPVKFADANNLVFAANETYKTFPAERSFLPALNRAFGVESDSASEAATAAAKRLVPNAASALPPVPGGLPPGAAVASIVVTTSPK